MGYVAPHRFVVLCQRSQVRQERAARIQAMEGTVTQRAVMEAAVRKAATDDALAARRTALAMTRTNEWKMELEGEPDFISSTLRLSQAHRDSRRLWRHRRHGGLPDQDPTAQMLNQLGAGLEDAENDGTDSEIDMILDDMNPHRQHAPAPPPVFDIYCSAAGCTTTRAVSDTSSLPRGWIYLSRWPTLEGRHRAVCPRHRDRAFGILAGPMGLRPTQVIAGLLENRPLSQIAEHLGLSVNAVRILRRVARQ
jgi:hypothetical protein